MKSFILSIVIIICVICLSIFNAVMIRNAVSDIIYNIEGSSFSSYGPDKAMEKWGSSKAFLNLSIRHTYMREIDDTFQRTQIAFEKGDEFEFDTAKASLIYKLKELLYSQGIYFKTLL